MDDKTFPVTSRADAEADAEWSDPDNSSTLLAYRAMPLSDRMTLEYLQRVVVPEREIDSLRVILDDEAIDRWQKDDAISAVVSTYKLGPPDDSHTPLGKTFSVSVTCEVQVQVEVRDGFTDADYAHAAVDQAVSLFDFAKVYEAEASEEVADQWSDRCLTPADL